MRIYCAVRHSLKPGRYYGDLWSGNFYPALRRLGCEIVESRVDLTEASGFMDIAGGFTSAEAAVREKITASILDEVVSLHRQRPIDLFLGYFYNAHFDPAGFATLHALGIPTVNFYCNSIYQFDLVTEIARKVAWSWHVEAGARDRYLAIGARPVHVQMGADPELYRPVDCGPRTARACFVGQRYADRDRLAAALLQNDVPLDLFGAGWQRTSGPAVNRETPPAFVQLGRRRPPPGSWRSYLVATQETLRREGLAGGVSRVVRQWNHRVQTRRLAPVLAAAAKGRASDVAETFGGYELVVNFSNVWADGRPGSALVPHVRLRDFEAPMCRACYLTGHTEEIAAFYEIGREIDTYRSTEELIEKSRFYLSRPEAAEKLRQAGYERARREHTWDRRFKELFERIGIKPAP